MVGGENLGLPESQSQKLEHGGLEGQENPRHIDIDEIEEKAEELFKDMVNPKKQVMDT
jgi:hypothetical protein